jgi:hypothetical protein
MPQRVNGAHVCRSRKRGKFYKEQPSEGRELSPKLVSSSVRSTPQNEPGHSKYLSKFRLAPPRSSIAELPARNSPVNDARRKLYVCPRILLKPSKYLSTKGGRGDDLLQKAGVVGLA